MLIAAWALGLRVLPDSEQVQIVAPVLHDALAAVDDLLSDDGEGPDEPIIAAAP
jgi:hypothetical protein